jgi:hypothetical protein
MAVGVGLGLAGLGTLAGGVLGYLGADKQADAAAQASADQIAFGREQAGAQARLGRQGAGVIGMTTPFAGQTLGAAGQQGIGEMMQGRNMAAGQLAGFGGQARQDLSAGFGAGQAALGSFLPGSRMEQLLNDPSSFQQDPGYQFRLQQGQQGLDRQAAARGGRAGSRAMQDMASFNQGLASQEFGNAFQRASAADQQRLGVLGSQAQLAGQAGQALAAQQSSLGANLGNLFSQSGQALGQAHMGLGGNMANLLMQGAQGQANALSGAAGNMAGLAAPTMNAMGAAVPYQGGGLTALGNMATQLGGLGMLGAQLAGGSPGGGAPAGGQAVGADSVLAPGQMDWDMTRR